MPAGFGEAEFTEKRSRFIGRVWPAQSEAEAQERIAAVRQRHHDATHNVYAYIIRTGHTRYSDDGEPQGTSGIPTLNVLQSEAVTNVCCVVTRYYGGILLGAGGLVRAYGKAAKMALDAAGLTLMRQWRQLLLPCPYALYERVKIAVADAGGIIAEAEFGADVLLEILAPVEQAPTLTQRILDMSAGTVAAEEIATLFRGVRIR